MSSMELHGYEAQISTRTPHEEWDQFVERVCGGHHVQTSLWAGTKLLMGWDAVRVIVCRDGRIAAGAQLLLRVVPWVGRMGYIARGPLFAFDDPMLEDLVMAKISEYCSREHVRYLSIQPPNEATDFAERLGRWGFRRSLIAFAPTPHATLVIDLNDSEEDILSRMRPSTRRNIRNAARKGVTVREAGEDEIEVFYQTLLATSERKGILEYPFEYWMEFYKTFVLKGHATILFAEYQGEVISSLLLVTFGNTVLYKKGGWTGRYGNLHANDLLQWEGIRLAKGSGFRWYDFEGIAPDAAEFIQRHGRVPDKYEGTVVSFKYGFGGCVRYYPEAYDRFYNPILRWMYRNPFRLIRFRSEVNFILNRYIRS